MYVALVPLNVAGRKVKAGESVPEAEKWQESVRRSHINLGWIKAQENGEPVRHNHSEPVGSGAVGTDAPVPEQQKKAAEKSQKKRAPKKAPATATV